MLDKPTDAMLPKSLAQYFFEIGYSACWADAYIKGGRVAPFEMTDAVVERAWQIAGDASADPAEFARNRELADRPLTAPTAGDGGNYAARLHEALGWFIDDERFQVAVGGNPNVVDRMLDDTRAIYLAILTPDPVQSDGEGWETFSDASYFDMWCVRKVGQRTFGQGFHLVNGDEAQDLADLLTRLTSLSAPVEKD